MTDNGSVGPQHGQPVPTGGIGEAGGQAGRQATAGERLERLLTRALGGRNGLMLVMATLIGVAGGYGAILFRLVIRLVERVAFPAGTSLAALHGAPWYRVILSPATGILVAGIVVYYLAREARGHGVPEVMDACHNQGGKIRPRVAAVKIAASALTIGSGGSVGREGPIVQIGASIGSSVGQFLGLHGDPLRTLLAAGAAAGIAATFNAPIAGFFFATEVILGKGSARTFSPLIVASVIATVITRVHLGNSPAFQVAPYELVSPWELPLYVVLGALAAVVAVGFTKGLYALEDLWALVPLPEPSKGLFGGAIVGAVALWLPQVMTVGYEHIEEVLHWEAIHLPLGTWQGAGLLLVLVLVLAKIFCTGTTIGAGGSGGIFAPSLFLGACLGGAFGTVANMLWPGAVASPGAYALVAMGAVVAGTTHAPLSAMLIVFEMTDRYTIILPLMLSCILSTLISIWLSRESIYTLKLLRRGDRLGASLETEIMKSTHVSTLTQPVGHTLHPDSPLVEIIEEVVEGHHPQMYVVDDAGRLCGVVRVEDVATIVRDEDELKDLLVGADVMRMPPGRVRPEETLDSCLERFGQRQVPELPVVDEERRLIGRIIRADVIAFYNREILRREAVLRFADEVRKEGPLEERVHLPTGDVMDEIAVEGALVGQTLRELNLRARFGVSVYAIREQDDRSSFPDPNKQLLKGHKLEVFGPNDQLARVRQLAYKARNGHAGPGPQGPSGAGEGGQAS